jgi:hypothetical protein
MLSLAQSISAVRKGDAAQRAALSEATAALEASISSIAADDAVVGKNAAISESVAQFTRWCVRKDIDELVAERAAAGVIAKVGRQRKPQSDFHTQSPDEARTAMNTRDAARGTKKPHQQRTRPVGPNEEPPDQDELENDALEELKHRAAALQKRDPALSEADAFTRTYLDPANTSLVKREHAQRMAKIAAARR